MTAVTISLSPNTENDDVRHAGRLLLSPQQWTNQAAVTAVEHRLTHILGEQPVVMTSSGRSALMHLIQALGIGSGDEVILQAFTCLAVPAAIRWAGATPVFADITPTTYNLDPTDVARKITPRTRAIIVQHTFGIPGPLAALRELAAARGLRLIEDCAHALGGTWEGQPLGTWGDAAILSFGRDKTLSSIHGGAVTSRDRTVIDAIRHQQAHYPLPPRSWVAQQLFHPVAFSLIRPLYFSASLGKVALVALQRAGLLGRAIEPSERRGQKPSHLAWAYSPALADLLELQLTKLDRYTAHRRVLAGRYIEAFPSLQSVGALVPMGAWLRVPLRVRNRRAVLETLRRHHLLLGDWYESPVTPWPHQHPTTITGYLPGSCPQAEAASRTVINLPTGPQVSAAQADQIIKLLHAYAQ